MFSEVPTKLLPKLIELMKIHPTPWSAHANYDRNGEFFAVIDGNGRVVSTLTTAKDESVILFTTLLTDLVNNLASQLDGSSFNIEDLSKAMGEETIPSLKLKDLNQREEDNTLVYGVDGLDLFKLIKEGNPENE
jgi:hypothetical protein